MTKSVSRKEPFPVQPQKIVPYPPLYTPPEDDTIDLLELAQTLWRWKWLIIALTLAGALGSYAVTAYLPKTYSATVIFRTPDEISLKRAVQNPKLLLRMVEAEKLTPLILSGQNIPTEQVFAVTPEEQAAGVLGAEESLSFDKEGVLEDLGEKNRQNLQKMDADSAMIAEMLKLPNLAVLNVQRPDPDATAKLANTLPGIINRYSKLDDLEQLSRKRLVFTKQVEKLREKQNEKMDEIQRFISGNGQSALLQRNKQTDVLNEVEMVLGQKLAEQALASVSLSGSGKLERLSGESKALERLIEEKSAEMALKKIHSVKLEGLQKIYRTLTEEEAKLVSALEQLELQQMRTENREVEMLSTASIPESPIKPKVRLIVALSAVVALFSGIFLSFLIEFVRNIRSQSEENTPETAEG